jgi:prevent-host-death family protein
MYHMKTATVRDLRNNFARVSAWISSGQEVEITKRGEVMARLVPVTSVKRKKKHDWAARMKRLKEISGGKKLSGNSVLLMREGSDW